MKIRGSRSYVTFDLENGYRIKATGEMLTKGIFLVYKDSMKEWEIPHDKEEVSENQIQEIIQQVKQNTKENSVQLIFE